MFAGSAGATFSYHAPRDASASPGYTPSTSRTSAAGRARVRVVVVGEAAGEPVRLIGHGFQNPCDGMRNARLKREEAFSHAMIIVSSAMVSSS
jgi:hypothetical protein